jgi:hypothetical protein
MSPPRLAGAALLEEDVVVSLWDHS